MTKSLYFVKINYIIKSKAENTCMKGLVIIMKVLIVGGVAGGAAAAARLRRLDETAEIILFERGEYISFANCGLPYYIGGTITAKDALTLQTPKSMNKRFNIDVRTKSEVTKIDTTAKTVTVKDLNTEKEYTEIYDKLILSPGASPIKPPIEGISSNKVFTLRNIPDTYRIKDHLEKEKPQKAAVVGGGYIGVEMAENLKNACLDVTVVELAEHLIAPLDFDMAADVHNYILEKGINIILNNGVKKIEDNENGLKLVLNDGSLDVDMLIMSVGVRPDTAFLESSGIEKNDRGSIIVNEYMETNAKDVYAVGDAVEIKNFVTKSPAFIPLAGPAGKQGRIAADNICGSKSSYGGSIGSAILKLFDMTVATTGINEKTANAQGINYDKTYTYSPSHAGYYPGGKNMSLKLLWEKDTKKIIGAQIVGFDGVDKRMDVLACAIRLGAKVTDLTELELCYAPPFSSAKDPVNMAGFVAENVINGKMKQFFWHDVAHLKRDGSVTLLDVRTKTEAESGMIDGFINIPVDELREHLNMLPKDKPVYVHCHTGLRSYIACRILAAHGYDCYNLAGGWRLYKSVTDAKRSPDYPCYKCE